MKEYRNYEKSLKERLADPAYAKEYLAVALEEYEKDGNIERKEEGRKNGGTPLNRCADAAFYRERLRHRHDNLARATSQCDL